VPSSTDSVRPSGRGGHTENLSSFPVCGPQTHVNFVRYGLMCVCAFVVVCVCVRIDLYICVCVCSCVRVCVHRFVYISSFAERGPQSQVRLRTL